MRRGTNALNIPEHIPCKLRQPYNTIKFGIMISDPASTAKVFTKSKEFLLDNFFKRIELERAPMPLPIVTAPVKSPLLS